MEPPVGDPQRDMALNGFKLGRHALGVMIWTSEAHAESVAPVNMLCSNMQFPSDATLKCIRHMLMHLLAFSQGNAYGRPNLFGLERPADVDVKQPYHVLHSFTGSLMLACSRVQSLVVSECWHVVQSKLSASDST